MRMPPAVPAAANLQLAIPTGSVRPRPALPPGTAGHCDQHVQRSRLRLIDVFPDACHQHENYPAFVREALACLSDQPLHHIGGAALAGTQRQRRLVHVQTAWVGLGPRCRGIVPGCYTPGSGRLPPTPRLVTALRTALAQCLRFDPAAAAPLHPLRVLVVDRAFESSRCAETAVRS